METRQRRIPIRYAAAWSAIGTVIGILVPVLIVVGLSGWDWSLFPQIFARLWIVFLSVISLVVLMSVLFALNPLRFTLAGLALVGFLLLFASAKETPFNQYLGGWINELWDMSLFSTSITVFALTVAIGTIASRRTNRSRQRRG
jgi:hypothetical protein